jgi:hypothetical protein
MARILKHPRNFLLLLVAFWIAVITLIHGWLNWGWFRTRSTITQEESFRIGFLPVT